MVCCDFQQNLVFAYLVLAKDALLGCSWDLTLGVWLEAQFQAVSPMSWAAAWKAKYPKRIGGHTLKLP